MFLEETSFRNRDITPANEITRRQLVFKGVFSKAWTCNKDFDDDDNDNDDNSDILTLKKIFLISEMSMLKKI